MNQLLVLLDDNIKGLIFFLIIFAAFGLILLAIIIVKKYVKPLQIDKDVNEEQAAEEELNRVLVPIEDEDIKKQMEEDAKKNAE